MSTRSSQEVQTAPTAKPLFLETLFSLTGNHNSLSFRSFSLHSCNRSMGGASNGRRRRGRSGSKPSRRTSEKTSRDVSQGETYGESSDVQFTAEQLLEIQQRHSEEVEMALAHFKESEGADFVCVNIVNKHVGYVFDNEYNAYWYHYHFKAKLRDASGTRPCLRTFYAELVDGLKGGIDIGLKVTDCHMFRPKDGSGDFSGDSTAPRCAYASSDSRALFSNTYCTKRNRGDICYV